MKNIVNKASEGIGTLVNKITGKAEPNTNRFQAVSSDDYSGYKSMDNSYKKESLIDRY
jgi:hypothetical protein